MKPCFNRVNVPDRRYFPTLHGAISHKTTWRPLGGTVRTDAGRAQGKGMVREVAIDYHEVGQRIAARRRSLGLRQSQVCEACGINASYLSNIERAVSIPSLEVFMRICDALDTTPDTLLLGTSSRGDHGLRQELTEQLRGLNRKQLILLKSFVTWLGEQEL